jgi:hypothetical protein
MRTTVTLDPDVDLMVKRFMSERGLGFKEAINEALRRSLQEERPEYAVPVRHLGEPAVDLDRALAVAAALEDEAVLAKMEQRR